MRVLIVNSHHYRRGGDSAQFLDHCAALRERGHEVAVFSMQHPDNLPSEWSSYWAPHVEYRGYLGLSSRLRAAWRGTYSFEIRRRMARLVRDFRPEVIHFHSIAHHLTLAVLDAGLAAHVPTVWTLHDYRTVCPASALLRHGTTCERCSGGGFWHCIAARCKSGELSRSAAGALEAYLADWRHVLDRVDCYVAPSAFLAGKVLQMGLRARRMEVVPNPVVVPAAEAPGRRKPRELLYVGRLSPEKGIGVLLQALAGDDGVTLRIMGDGPQEAELRNAARPVNGRVAFEGWAEPGAVRAAMAEAALLCVPSVWYENCPGVVLEAMSCGLPVVASDIGGLAELTDHGRAGWLAPAGDANAWRRVVRTALDEPELSARLADAALARVLRRHDPHEFIAKLERVYRSLGP